MNADVNWYEAIPNLYNTHADPIQTEDGFVIAFEDEILNGFWGKTYNGEYVFERVVEDLYIKHDVHIFNNPESAMKEFYA